MSEAVKVTTSTTEVRRVSIAFGMDGDTPLYAHVCSQRRRGEPDRYPTGPDGWREPVLEIDGGTFVVLREAEWPSLRAAIDRAFKEFHDRFDPKTAEGGDAP